MRKAIFGGLVLLLVASQAMAGDKVWSVPGVVNNGVATVFSCSNGGTAAASVAVDLFNKNGGAAGAGTANVPAGGTANLATQTVAMLPVLESNLGAASLQSGSARITAPSSVYCSAYVVDPVNDPPTVAWSLKVIKKTSQKGD